MDQIIQLFHHSWVEFIHEISEKLKFGLKYFLFFFAVRSPPESFVKANMMKIIKGVGNDWILKIIELRKSFTNERFNPLEKKKKTKQGSNLFNFIFFSNSIRERKSIEKVFPFSLPTNARFTGEKELMEKNSFRSTLSRDMTVLLRLVGNFFFDCFYNNLFSHQEEVWGLKVKFSSWREILKTSSQDCFCRKMY